MTEPLGAKTDRRLVDTWFGVVFIFILVVLLYPTAFMFFHSLWGPEPPDPPDDYDPQNPAAVEAFVQGNPVGWFMAVNQAWFVGGVVLPAGVAAGAYRLARHIFREANPKVLKWAAVVSVGVLYAAGTIVSLF
ncbi:MAG: hypothetical protein EXQ86_11800 [Rhodospirillales bacterium]|nr:hypothetical protein [Rhodospirillales bacterium]